MTRITDPTPGLLSFSSMFAVGALELQRGDQTRPSYSISMRRPGGRVFRMGESKTTTRQRLRLLRP